MKKLLITTTLLITPFFAFANHFGTATQDMVKCGKTILVGQIIPDCDNGPIMENQPHVVYKARTFVNGVSNEEPVVLKILTNEKEAYRLSMLDLARSLLQQGWKVSQWPKNISDWMVKYQNGER